MEASLENPKYSAYLVTGGGSKYNITNVLEDLSLTEGENSLAQKCDFTIANIKTKSGLMSGIVDIAQKIYVYADTGSGKKEVFRGTIWTRKYNSADEKVLPCVAYDHLIYAENSEDTFYFPAGKSTKSIFSTICGKWGIKLNYKFYSITHPKQTNQLQKKYISDMFLELLKEVKKKNGQKYIIRSANDTMTVSQRGTNGTIYHFVSKQNVEQTTSSRTLSGVITQVAITGKEDKEGRSPVEAIVKGQTGAYGTLQAIIERKEGTTLAEAKQEAQELINENGKPFESFSINGIDCPWVRKGDKISVSAGDLSGTFYVVSVDHDAKKKKMRMEVER